MRQFIFFSLFLFLILSENCNAQTVFDKRFYFLQPSEAVEVIEQADSGYMVLCSTGDGTGRVRKLYMVRTDSKGDTIFTRYIPAIPGNEDEPATAMIMDSDSNFIMVGYSGSVWTNHSEIYLVKTDKNGNPFWIKTFGDTTKVNYSYSVKETFDRGYIITGVADRVNSTGAWGDMYFIKTDSAGNLEWEKKYGQLNTGDEARDIIQLPDSGYLATGVLSGSPGVNIFRLNSFGDTLFKKTWLTGGNSQTISKITDSLFIVSTYSIPGTILKIDINGDTIWTTSVGSLYLAYVEAVNSGFICAGAITGMNADMYFGKLDLNGAVEWTKTFSTFENDVARKVHPTKDGGYILCGYMEHYGMSSPSIATIIKTDSLGSIITNTQEEFLNTGTISIFPNPTAGSIIHISLDKSVEKGEMDIYNLVGEKVYSEPFNGKQKTINCKLPPGIYFVQISSADGSIAKKLVITE